MQSVILSIGMIASVATAVPAVRYVGANGAVRLLQPASLLPNRDFPSGTLMTSGWRLSWDAAPTGPGTRVVSFTEVGRPASGEGHVKESVQVGMSRNAAVVAHCGTTGLSGPSSSRLPDQKLGGHRWTVYRNGDAGMSQEIVSTDFRTVVDGTCYAIARISYTVRAGPSLPRSAPEDRTAAAHIDAILASISVGRLRG